MIKQLFMVLAASSLTLLGAAQTTYTLQQCIDTALQKSLQLKSDNLSMDKTKAGIGQAYSSLLPTVDGSASYQYYFKVPQQLLPSSFFGGTAGEYKAASLSVPQTKSVGLQLNQTLFNASSLIALKAAKVAVNINQLQIQSSKEDLVYNVSATYYNIQSVLKQMELTQSNLAINQSLLQVTTDQFKAGLATQTDVDRLTVTRDNTQATLQSNLNSLEKQYNMLKVLMNIPLESNIAVAQDEYNDAQATGSLAATDFDPNKKTNYLQVLENKRVADLQRLNIKAGYLPTLSLGANYGVSGYNDEVNPFKNLTGKWYPSSYFSLKLNVPLFDGFSKKYQVKQKEAEIKQYDVQAQQTLQQNSRDVADAYADLKSNYITLQNQKRNLVLAQKVLDDINTQYKSGLVKLTDAINAQQELQTAQNNYINALINIKQATLNLKKAKGTLIN
jgi:outer membrane protein